MDTLRIPCPTCLVENHVAPLALDEEPSCADCGGPLLSTPPPRLDERTFAPYVTRSDLPVAVFFDAVGCPGCAGLEAGWEAVAQRLAGDVLFVRLDRDACTAAGEAFGVTYVPQVVLIVAGALRGRLGGAHEEAQLGLWLGQQLLDD